MRVYRWLAVLAVLAAPAQAAQDQLAIDTAIAGPALTFDWPELHIGIGSYEDGPTGLTIFRFPNRVSAAVDVRGGAPGTVNTDLLRLGYSTRFIDAVVFSGRSSYGEESIRETLDAAPPGIIRPRSWACWNAMFGRYPAPPMPRGGSADAYSCARTQSLMKLASPLAWKSRRSAASS